MNAVTDTGYHCSPSYHHYHHHQQQQHQYPPEDHCYYPSSPSWPLTAASIDKFLLDASSSSLISNQYDSHLYDRKIEEIRSIYTTPDTITNNHNHNDKNSIRRYLSLGSDGNDSSSVGTSLSSSSSSYNAITDHPLLTIANTVHHFSQSVSSLAAPVHSNPQKEFQFELYDPQKEIKPYRRKTAEEKQRSLFGKLQEYEQIISLEEDEIFHSAIYCKECGGFYDHHSANRPMTSFEQEYNKSCCGHIRLSLLNHQQQHHHLKNHSTPPPLGYTFYNDHSVKSPSNIRGSPEGNYPLFTSYDKENYLPPALVIEQQQQEKLLNKKTPLTGFEHCHPNNHPHHHRHPEQKLHQHRNNSSSETHSFIRNSVYFSCSRSFFNQSINQSKDRHYHFHFFLFHY